MNLNPPYQGSEKGALPSLPPKFDASQSAPAYEAFRTTFASLSLHRSDRIRLLSFPQHDIEGIRSVIRQTYTKGIQQEQRYGGSYEFKMYGNPWYGQSSDAVLSRILVREILAYLFKIGWILHASTDCSKKVGDKDTMFFRKQQHAPPDSDWISISFNQSDRIRLIGAPPDLRAGVKSLLMSMHLLQEDKEWKDQRLGAWEFKLNGYPWRASGEETMNTRLLLLRLLECLERYGWSLYGSIDQSATGQENSSETDSWYCVRDKNWVEGAAVFHR